MNIARGLFIVPVLLLNLILLSCHPFTPWRLDRGVNNLSGHVSNNGIRGNFIKKWEVSLDSTSGFSPIIGYNKLFVGLDNGHMVAIRPRDGSIIWSYQAEARISNSAAVQKLKDQDSPYLWFTSDDGNLVSLDAETGSLRWLLRGSGNSFQSAVNYDVPDKIFYNYSDGVNSKTRSVNAITGEINWESSGQNISTATPLLYEPDDLIIQGYYSGGTGTITAYHEETGNIEWTIPGTGTLSSGIENQYWNLLYFSSGGKGVFSYNANLNMKLWEMELPSMVIHDEVLGLTLKPLPDSDRQGILIVTMSTSTYALNTLDGELLWTIEHTENAHDPFNRRTSLPVIFNDYLVAVENSSMLVVRDVLSGRELWNYRLDSPTTSSPAISGDSIFIVSGKGTLYRFALCDDRQWYRWRR